MNWQIPESIMVLSSGTLDIYNTDGTLVTDHSITLSGLAFNTTYYFQVTSVDAFT